MDHSSRAGSALYIYRPGSLDTSGAPGDDPPSTPADIFPNINIPVLVVSWQFTGLNPEEMEGRITTVYERTLTTLVDNIEHIESTTVNGAAVVKIFLQPGASLDTANAQVTAASQTILRQLPAGNPAAADHQLQCVECADSPARSIGPRPHRIAIERHRAQFPTNATGDGSGRGRAVSIRRQAASGDGLVESAVASSQGTFAVGRGLRSESSESGAAFGHRQNRSV